MNELVELLNAFDLEYQSASNQAPDINMYEKSYFLTKAVDKLISDSIPLFDRNETSKRLLQPLLVQSHKCQFTEVICELKGLKKYKVIYPKDFRVLTRLSINTELCSGLIVNKEDMIDNINETVNNPFRKPSRKRVIKVVGELQADVKYDFIYTSLDTRIQDIYASYIKYNNPIILMDFQDDPTAIGDESIKGLNTSTMTELTEEFIPHIIKGAVTYAVKTLRSNTLNTNINL